MGRLEHGEPLVVLRGDNDPFHPRVPGQPGDPPGVELGGVELLGKGHVFDLGNLHLPLDPLADPVEGPIVPLAAEMGKQPPVDEHAVLPVAKERGPIGLFEAGRTLTVPHI